MLVRGAEADERYARGLAESLDRTGVEVVYLSGQCSARDIAAAAAQERADAVELCLPESGGVPLLRDLLRALIDMGRRDVSIVIHRVQALGARGSR